MNLYSAPRPPRKKRPPAPRSAASGKFRPLEPLDDMEVFSEVLAWVRSMQGTIEFLRHVAPSFEGGDPQLSKFNAVSIYWLQSLVDVMAPALVTGEAQDHHIENGVSLPETLFRDMPSKGGGTS